MKSKNIFSILAGILLIFSLASCSKKSKNVDEKVRFITTEGYANIFVDPDQADANFVVTTYDRIAVTATEQNTQNINNIVTSLKEIGVNEKDITIKNPSITVEGGRYVVSTLVTVLIRNISKAPAIIDSAMGAGKASELKSYRHLLSDNTELVKQVKLDAIQNAFDNAKLLATASGSSLGKVISISEYKYPLYENDTVTDAGTKLMFSASVNITYELTNE